MEQYVVVLGYNLWRTDFGGDPKVLGRKLQLNGKLFEVVGVAPQGVQRAVGRGRPLGAVDAAAGRRST